MDAQSKQLYDLMATAEQHQQAVKAAIQGLAEEQAALSQAAASMSGVVGDVKQATAEAVPVIHEAVSASVAKSLASASDEAAKALSEAAKPILDSLSSVVRAADAIEGKLSRATASFGWKWIALAGGAAAGGIVAVVLIGWLSIWWQRHEVQSLLDQKAALQGEVVELQANVATLEKKGGRIKLDKCGPESRLCIEITPNQGKGKSLEDFHGSWTDQSEKRRFVIPMGY